ncbi:hypothetical protein BDW02DRAFT_492083 [Decorospora gaudefroyi]|uniref:Fork-head domain-containing protein n=1 Tax=Decorospora gaudefroyi TaxID=184978 RepID=A0A6A5KU53_9PLEO|nr:hypothetical protein BDW02DRAFT_492083 [Decorospora gaudefroyi]
MATSVHDSAPSSDHRTPHSAMSLDEQQPLQWTAPTGLLLNYMGSNGADYNASSALPSGPGDYYGYAQNGMSYNGNYSLAYAPQYPDSSCPRSYTGLDLTDLPNDVSVTDAYPPTAYHIEPPKNHDAMDLSDHEINGQLTQLSNDYEHQQYSSRNKIQDHSGYQSPYSDLTRASTPHDDIPRHPDGTVIDKEQPYAQLIYQALMNAPGRTMILRDIYDWFKANTDKATGSETKGWQNSIRHNLSMNGAFEKVDQPCDEARKGFMWRLTEEAIRDGVKSTTRYRSKQPNKRAHRTQQPLPQRQASGAKGGQAARRSARMKRLGNMYDYSTSARSVPSAFDPCYLNQQSPHTHSYPYSPYYSDGDFKSDPDFGSPLGGPLFPPPPLQPRAYLGSPMLQGVPITDTGYVLDQSPTASLFTNSPSPTADEPRTPGDLGGGWQEDVGVPCVFDEQIAYREYAG